MVKGDHSVDLRQEKKETRSAFRRTLRRGQKRYNSLGQSLSGRYSCYLNGVISENTGARTDSHGIANEAGKEQVMGIQETGVFIDGEE